MLRVTAGGKSVGGIVLDNVHLGLGQAAHAGHLLHHAMQTRLLLRRHLMGAG
ncbi:unnamed protein product, partial [marine sediment metagenome]